MGCGANKGYEIPSNDERDGDDVTEERHSSSEAVQNMRLLTVACDPLRILFIRVKFKSMILFALLTVYVAITLVIFFQTVIPSFVEGTTSEMFAVDSTVYVYFADSIREGRNEPWVLYSLLSFPNNLWSPVLISLILNSALLVMLTNYAVFATSILLLKRTCSISLGAFVPLLLLNPTTTTSLLCVNKEALDLLSISLFLYARAKRRNGLVLAVLAFAFLNRWEMCVEIIVFVIAESRLNPWREKRLSTLLLLIVTLNFVMPSLGSKMLDVRFIEAQAAHTIAFLDIMQMHYLFVLAVVPKIAENLFGQLLNPQVWQTPSSWLLINLFNNAAYAILILIAAKRRLLTLRNDLVYFAALGAVIAAQSLAVQPRYFYFVYVLLCLVVAQLKPTSGQTATTRTAPVGLSRIIARPQ
jgi:hypothetical protein